jgi:CheY-like chemotaxis protein
MVNESIVGAGVVDGVVGKTVILASADTGLRQRLRASLAGLRWQVREAGGGAEAIAQMEASQPEAIFVDSWLPDLEVGEFAGQIRLMYPGTELLRIDGVIDGAARSPRRNELLHALREAEDRAVTDTAAWAAAPMGVPKAATRIFETQSFGRDGLRDLTQQIVPALREREEPARAANPMWTLPEMVGTIEPVRELARLIRLLLRARLRC